MGPSIDCTKRQQFRDDILAAGMQRPHFVRPSLLDPDLPSEPGFLPCQCMPQLTVLYLVNRPVAIIPATSIDQASLSSCLEALRMRAPRCAASA